MVCDHAKSNPSVIAPDITGPAIAPRLNPQLSKPVTIPYVFRLLFAWPYILKND